MSELEIASEAVVRSHTRFSMIWVLPLLALVLGVWLLWKGFSERGVEIHIVFPDAEGIEIGKTKVRFKGLIAGEVTDIDVTEDRSAVVVTTMMDNDLRDLLTDGTRFWLVKAEASLAGISALDTLFSGNYIGMSIGPGDPVREFYALGSPPVATIPQGAVQISLSAEELGSLRAGAPVYFRQIQVGEILNTALIPGNQQVEIQLYVHPEYASLVKEASRFWHVSGIEIDASLSGVKIRTESLSALLAGGVAFSSPPGSPSVPVTQTADYKLFRNLDAAQAGTRIQFQLDPEASVEEGRTRIRFRNIDLGYIDKVNLNRSGTLTATAMVDPRADPFLVTGTRFWLVKLGDSLRSLSNLPTLISGSYVTLEPGDGDFQRTFYLYASKPPVRPSKPGLHVRLKAKELNGIDNLSQVYYRNLPIGQVQDTHLAEGGGHFSVDIYIEDKYSHLVRKNSQFWNSSGISLEGDLRGFALSTGPLENLLAGGIALYTPPDRQRANPAQSGDSFTLYENFSQVIADVDPLEMWENNLVLRLKANQLGSIQRGSPVYYRQLEVGEVYDYRLASSKDHVLINIRIRPRYKHLVNRSSRFWNASGVAVDASLTRLRLRTESLASILSGGISFDTPEPNAKRIGNGTVFTLFPDQDEALATGPRVVLEFKEETGLKPGNAVRYKGVTIGQVSQVNLSRDLARVLVTLRLEPGREIFASRGASFHLVAPTVGISGIKNLQGVITGNWLEASPGNGKRQEVFTGLLMPRAEAGTLRIQLVARRLGSLRVGNPVYYRQVPVGQITALQLGPTADRVQLTAEIAPRYRVLVRTTSRFWNASGIQAEFGLFSGARVKTESVETVLAGGIAFATPDELPLAPLAAQDREFVLFSDPDPTWQEWNPMIPLAPAPADLVRRTPLP